MRPRHIAVLMAVAAVPALATAGGHSPGAMARMMGPDGAEMGTVSFTATPGGVLIEADLTGLPPGGHGFHLHETGRCEPDFGAAGGHYNPAGSDHGLMNATGHHAGDLPNLFAAADGTARADVHTAAVSLEDGAEATLFDDDGSAVIVHENPDTYGADAGAGGRLACGVIERG